MRINQFHSGTAVGDAITNQMLLLRDILKKNRYESDIYAEFIPKELEGDIIPIKQYKSNENNILIIHHSMGTNVFDQICGLDDKKILIYHNITPERFFDDEYTKKYIRIGLQQVKKYRDQVDYYIADSNYNRKELISMGYPSTIDVMPVQISLDRFEKTNQDEKLYEHYKDSTNILFVGRVVWNKCQTDLVRSFAVYNKYYNENSNMFIVGDDGMAGYVNEIKALAKQYEILEKVHITGKVGEEQLKTYYRLADVFLCMSEHEGFGVPLLEAMKMEVPVVAYRSSAIPETMGGAGVIITEKNHAYVGALINEIVTDQDLKKRICDVQTERIKKLETTDTEKILMNAINNLLNNDRSRTIQMQGPFETSYSLAIVNRKLIEAIDDRGDFDASIYCTEGPGDYEPREKDLEDKKHAKELWEKSEDVAYPDITIRNMYPPRVHDVIGGLNFQAFGWEESVIPSKYIIDFNKYLDGIGTMSNYVSEKLLECGLHIPVKTMGIGVELPNNFNSLKPYKLKTKKKYHFLHISSAFPRKGVDILIKGFYKAFTNDDDVCLVLKTFSNPHNNVQELIGKNNEKYPNHPEIEWINCDLSEEDLYGLYKTANCYVQVARGEGFGLPVAEAMLAKVPVIVSPNSGMADFCNDNTALLVGYELQQANTHLVANDSETVSLWAEPDVDELASKMKRIVTEDKEAISNRVKNAYQLISTYYTWDKVAERWKDFIDEIDAKKCRTQVAMVTTWNSKCGIAEYTKMEVEASEHYVSYGIYPNYGVELLKTDENNVHKRVWHSAFEGNMDVLTHDLLSSVYEIVHFQFNFGFYNLEQLAGCIDKLVSEKKVVITFHKTDDADVLGKTVSLKSIVRSLNKCSALVVHQQSDVNSLCKFGVRSEIIQLIPLGQVRYPEISSRIMKIKRGIDEDKYIVGSYGFFLPHKGIKETIQAIAILRKKYKNIMYMPVCALHDSVESHKYYEECRKEIEKLDLNDNVKMITDFLPNDTSMMYLQACDMFSMVYKPSKESASGAVRFCIAALRPLLTTKQPIFDEFEDCAYQIDATVPEQIAIGIEKCMNKDFAKKLVQEEKKRISETAWDVVGKKYAELYTQLIEENSKRL